MAPSLSYSTFSGAATSLIHNFQIQNMLKDSQGGGTTTSGSSAAAAAAGSNSMDSSKKLNEAEACRICSILSTAEYCLETTQQVT
jgi:hypothetical protein